MSGSEGTWGRDCPSAQGCRECLEYLPLRRALLRGATMRPSLSVVPARRAPKWDSVTAWDLCSRQDWAWTTCCWRRLCPALRALAQLSGCCLQVSLWAGKRQARAPPSRPLLRTSCCRRSRGRVLPISPCASSLGEPSGAHGFTVGMGVAACWTWEAEVSGQDLSTRGTQLCPRWLLPGSCWGRAAGWSPGPCRTERCPALSPKVLASPRASGVAVSTAPFALMVSSCS